MTNVLLQRKVFSPRWDTSYPSVTKRCRSTDLTTAHTCHVEPSAVLSSAKYHKRRSFYNIPRCTAPITKIRMSVTTSGIVVEMSVCSSQQINVPITLSRDNGFDWRRFEKRCQRKILCNWNSWERDSSPSTVVEESSGTNIDTRWNCGETDSIPIWNAPNEKIGICLFTSAVDSISQAVTPGIVAS